MGKCFDAIFRYEPFNEQERVDRWLMFDFIGGSKDVLTRENRFGHFSATAFIVNESRDQFVVVHHKVYDAWMLPGGHADGQENLLVVAMTEAEEETGLVPRVLNDGEPFALQALPTLSHYHRTRGYVPAHTHYDVTYLFEAPDNALLKCNVEESKDIRWISFEMADGRMVADFMRPVHAKLIEKLQTLAL